jgi:hypothetical protein
VPEKGAEIIRNIDEIMEIIKSGKLKTTNRNTY